ncbi:MAG TPA: trehalose-phosphatase [Acidimicrobiales bacterium]|nr:trehalose-phosphatase [Acidimicrobiales bacterium]
MVTDFDGTLAPIVPVPEDARPLPGAADVLVDLAASYARVAVVSGRPAAFLARHLGLYGEGAGAPANLSVSGIYGLEALGPDGSVEVVAEAEAWRSAVEAATAEARASSPAGAGVEPKGLSVTLHWRTAPAAEGWAADFVATAGSRWGLVAHPARMSVELRPPLAIDKGTVVERLTAGFEAACFLGDDRGDLPAFAALDRLGRGGALVVKVGVRSPEAPPELLGAADLVVDGPEGALELLRRLAAREP